MIHRISRFLQQVVVCREGWYFLFVLAFVITGAVLRDINLLIVVAGMMIGPLLFNLVLVWVSLRGIRVQRQLPPAVCAGDLLVVGVAVENNRARGGSWALAVADQIRLEGRKGRKHRASSSVLFSYVAAGQTRHGSYVGRLTERGRYTFYGMTVSTRFPFGLVRRTMGIPGEDTLLVYPRLGRLTAQWNRLQRQRMLGSRRSQHKQGTMEGDFFGLRDWRPGDSQRWIHWRTSARYGSLVVRQFEEQQNEDMLLLLDLGSPSNPTEQQHDNVELACSFAATVASDVCRRGNSQLTLVIGGKSMSVVEGVTSSGLKEEILQRLAVVEPASDVDLREVVAAGFRRSQAGTKTILVSTGGRQLGSPEQIRDWPAEITDQFGRRRLMSVSAAGEELLEHIQFD